MATHRLLTAAPTPGNANYMTDRAEPSTAEEAGSERRILMPFTGGAISRRSIEAAVRIAKTENATLIPALLTRVPREIPIGSTLPGLGTQAIPALEAIEQQAAAEGITVEARVARGRTYRDALNHVLSQEPFDRILVPMTDSPFTGLSADDLKWLVQRGPAEITVVRSPVDDSGEASATRSRARGRG